MLSCRLTFRVGVNIHVTMSTQEGTQLHRVIHLIIQTPGVTQGGIVEATDLTMTQVQRVVAAGRRREYIAKTFRGHAVLRTEIYWERKWAELNAGEKRVVRRLRANDRIMSLSKLARSLGWATKTLGNYAKTLREDNILVRDGALFLGRASEEYT